MSMHATITDQKALSEVPYDRLIAFLEREGFMLSREIDHDSKLYKNRMFSAYAYRDQDGIHATFMDITLIQLSIALDRSQLDIYADIMGFRWVRLYLTPQKVDHLPYHEDEEQPQ